MAGSGLKRLFTGPDGTQLGTVVADSDQEISEQLQGTAEYVAGLSDEQREAYELVVANNLLQVLDDVSSQAQSPRSSVTITEIEEDGPSAAPEHVPASSADRPRAD
jgi:hypothetical protein